MKDLEFKISIWTVFFTIFVLAGIVEATPPLKSSIQVGQTSESQLIGLAKISMDEAIAKAIKEVPGKPLKAELETEHGNLVYQVEVVRASGEVIEATIDAGNGKLLAQKADRKDSESEEDGD